MLQNFTLGTFSQGASGGGTAFESIASATGTASSGTITFSGITGTYQSLQIRGYIRPSAGDALYVRFNSDSGSNYSYHYLAGNGTSTFAAGYATQTEMYANTYTYPSSTNGQAIIIDIHDYANTSRNKTMRVFTGSDLNGSGSVDLVSGLWRSTSAITSITLTLVGGANYTTASNFALYGIKGA